METKYKKSVEWALPTRPKVEVGGGYLCFEDLDCTFYTSKDHEQRVGRGVDYKTTCNEARDGDCRAARG